MCNTSEVSLMKVLEYEWIINQFIVIKNAYI